MSPIHLVSSPALPPIQIVLAAHSIATTAPATTPDTTAQNSNPTPSPHSLHYPPDALPESPATAPHRPALAAKSQDSQNHPSPVASTNSPPTSTTTDARPPPSQTPLNAPPPPQSAPPATTPHPAPPPAPATQSIPTPSPSANPNETDSSAPNIHRHSPATNHSETHHKHSTTPHPETASPNYPTPTNSSPPATDSILHSLIPHHCTVHRVLDFVHTDRPPKTAESSIAQTSQNPQDPENSPKTFAQILAPS